MERSVAHRRAPFHRQPWCFSGCGSSDRASGEKCTTIHDRVSSGGSIVSRSLGAAMPANHSEAVPDTRCHMDVYLIDGTYELFRHFYAVPAAADEHGREIGAVRGVLRSVLSMVE